MPEGVTGKDIILTIIGEIGTAAAPAMCWNMPARRSARYRMEGRMTVCNMSIEGGARAGLIAPDEKAFDSCAAGRNRRRARHGTPRCATGKRCAR